MILIILLIIAFLIVIAKSKPNDSYDEYCKLECWSVRKPCCKTQ